MWVGGCVQWKYGHEGFVGVQGWVLHMYGSSGGISSGVWQAKGREHLKVAMACMGGLLGCLRVVTIVLEWWPRSLISCSPNDRPIVSCCLGCLSVFKQGIYVLPMLSCYPIAEDRPLLLGLEGVEGRYTMIDGYRPDVFACRRIVLDCLCAAFVYVQPV